MINHFLMSFTTVFTVNALLSPLGASLFSGILEGDLIEWGAYLKLSKNER